MNGGLKILALLPLSLLLLWGTVHWGSLSALDLWMFDRMQRIGWIGTPPPVPLLLVEIDARAPPPGTAQWTAAIETLRHLEARVIGILTPPAELHPAAQTAGTTPPLVLGRWLEADDDDSTRYQPLDDSTAALESLGAVAGVAVPPLDGGIVRYAPSVYRLDSGEQPAFAWLIARVFGLSEAELPRADFGLDFSAATANLPHVSFERALAGDLIRELVAGKAVIIATTDPTSPGLATPAAGSSITLAQYQGIALATLLAQRQITPLAPFWQLLILVALAAGLWSLCILTSEAVRPWLLAVFLVAILLLAWLLLLWARLWMGLAVPVLGTILTFMLALRYTELARQARLRELALEGSVLLDRHRLPAAFYASSEHWGQVATLVTQLLDLKRTIFLERVPSDHRVREVKALHCSFDEINEQRRDYERSPYTDAIAENQPVLLQRQFLIPREGEEQYLMALMFGGDILGFWAFAVAPLNGLEQRRLLNAATELGRQVTELLYQRQRWQDQERRQGHLWSRLVRGESPTSTQQLIGATYDRLRRRLQVMESVLDGIGSAAILYDLFGRVVQVNVRMAEILQGLKLTPYELTALDLLARLAEVSLDEARLYLRRVILERNSLQLTVTLEAASRETYLLRISALTTDDVQVRDSAPFELLGLLLELIDLSAAQEAFRFKERLVDQLGIRYRDGLETIQLASSLIDNPKLDPERRTEIVGVLHRTLSDITEFGHMVEELLRQDLLRVPAEYFPLSLLDAIAEAIEEAGPLYRARQIRVETQLPRIVALVQASPLQLARLLGALLRLMIEDCVDEGRLRLSLQTEREQLTLNLDNTGLGLPDARLQDYLFGTEELESEDLNILREGRLLIEQWGGRLTLHGEVGEGLRASLELRVFSGQPRDRDPSNEFDTQ